MVISLYTLTVSCKDIELHSTLKLKLLGTLRHMKHDSELKEKAQNALESLLEKFPASPFPSIIQKLLKEFQDKPFSSTTTTSTTTTSSSSLSSTKSEVQMKKKSKSQSLLVMNSHCWANYLKLEKLMDEGHFSESREILQELIEMGTIRSRNNWLWMKSLLLLTTSFQTLSSEPFATYHSVSHLLHSLELVLLAFQVLYSFYIIYPYFDLVFSFFF